MYCWLLDYIVMGFNEEFFLGEEFQSLLKCFVDYYEKKVMKRFVFVKKFFQ